MKIVVFNSARGRAQGLQHRPYIDGGTLFVFPEVTPGGFFHSRNVPEPFDIAFVSAELEVLSLWKVTPPNEIADAPPGAAIALEAKSGRLKEWGIRPGVRLPFDPLHPTV